MLDVGDGQQVYWEACGDPNGKPAVVLHGGPGSGCTRGLRRYFDPGAYRIVLFDQRGAGRSVPHAGDPTVDLTTNTTPRLIADIELLRAHLGVERWLVFGVSWGATLALAYAARHPQRVTEVVLAPVTMTRPAEIHWLYHGVGRFFPEEWARFRDGVPVGERDGDLVAAYHRLLNQPDPAVREKAARDWCAWEDAVVSLESDYQPNPRYEGPAVPDGLRQDRHALLPSPGLARGRHPATRSAPSGRDSRHPDPWSPGPGQPAGHRVEARPRVVGRRAAPCRYRPHWWGRDDRTHRRGHRPLLEGSLIGTAQPARWPDPASSGSESGSQRTQERFGPLDMGDVASIFDHM